MAAQNEDIFQYRLKRGLGHLGTIGMKENVMFEACTLFPTCLLGFCTMFLVVELFRSCGKSNHFEDDNAPIGRDSEFLLNFG